VRSSIAVLAVLAAVVPAAALAGGWATVQLSSTPAGVEARAPWVVT
jgi:hypothetical protein